MERRLPAGITRRERSAMRRDECRAPVLRSFPQKVGSERSGVKRARLQALSRCERDLLRRRSDHAAEKPGRIEPWRDLNAVRCDTFPIPRFPAVPRPVP